MKKAENTHRHIIEKAAPIFNIKGIAATSVVDVTKAANVARGCLYGHFESKDELAYACVDYLLQSATEGIIAAMDRKTSAFGKIVAFLDTNKPERPMLVGGCPLMNLSTEADDTNPVIKKKLRSSIDHHIRIFTDVLKHGVISGEFSSELDVDDFSLRMFCSIKGAVVLGGIKNSPAIMKSITQSVKKELESYLTKPAATPIN